MRMKSQKWKCSVHSTNYCYRFCITFPTRFQSRGKWVLRGSLGHDGRKLMFIADPSVTPLKLKSYSKKSWDRILSWLFGESNAWSYANSSVQILHFISITSLIIYSVNVRSVFSFYSGVFSWKSSQNIFLSVLLWRVKISRNLATIPINHHFIIATQNSSSLCRLCVWDVSQKNRFLFMPRSSLWICLP